MATFATRAAEASTVLVAPRRHLGGTVSGGLSWTDIGDTRAFGGLARCARIDVRELQRALADAGQALAL